MAVLETHFYHKTIHFYTGVFGTIFNNMKVKNGNRMVSVPIQYAGQDKMNVAKDRDDNRANVRFKQRLPKLTYVLRGWNRDDSRMKNRQLKMYERPVNGTEAKFQYNRIPYNFTYELRAKTKHLDDLLQICEQIMAYFNPNLQVIVDDNPDLPFENTINITMTDSSMEDQFEGLYEDGRTLEAVFNFTLEGYIYLPTMDSKVINQVKINYHQIIDPDTILIDQQEIPD